MAALKLYPTATYTNRATKTNPYGVQYRSPVTGEIKVKWYATEQEQQQDVILFKAKKFTKDEYVAFQAAANKPAPQPQQSNKPAATVAAGTKTIAQRSNDMAKTKTATATVTPAKGKSAKPTRPASQEPKTPRDPNALSDNKVKTLAALAKAPNGLSRSELAEKTGIQKGWAKLLGAPTKGDAADGTLEGLGFVKSVKLEGERSMKYTITASGKKALEKSSK